MQRDRESIPYNVLFPRCGVKSDCGQVITAYETQGYGMLEKAFNETGYLEKLTGLDKLYEEATAVMENVDFGEGEGDEDDF